MGDNNWTPGPASTPTQISTGSLKTKISLKNTYQPPFYTLKSEIPPRSNMLGSTDLLAAYDLASVYSRFCGNKKLREDLASFLPSIYGNLNITQAQDISNLQLLVNKPPICGKEINTLSATSMTGFRLNPGPVDERYRYMFETKRDDPIGQNGVERREKEITGGGHRFKSSLDPLDVNGEDTERRKHKSEKKEKKKKKDKKKKDKKDEDRKHKRSMDPSAPSGSGPSMMEF